MWVEGNLKSLVSHFQLLTQLTLKEERSDDKADPNKTII